MQRQAAMTWAQRLKRVFYSDVETCRICGRSAEVIACIEAPVIIYTQGPRAQRVAGNRG